MPSPSRDRVVPMPATAAAVLTDLQPPPSPRTHRALRRLQSAHALGSRAANQASLISQQRREQQQLGASPVGDPDARRSPQRGRATSDATPPAMPQMSAAVTAAKRAGSKKPVFSHGHLSLQQMIRDGPNEGDLLGALETARWKVIDEGVKAAEDGMVRCCAVDCNYMHVTRTVAWLTCSFL